ncbi:hypothetical protein V2J94_46870 [Streptomyces sp. DSM 41524]|uniref:Uncharacterized protein n=1 Tax=Streptomyces asiaticus subsp. ignotus TaxID=3098222 RepID=A0ABU7QCW5_9ACTN|nr:hypothetical protein [Streptomyces sp. DSM 41524]
MTVDVAGFIATRSELASDDSKLLVPSPESQQRTIEHDTDGR